MDWIIAVVLLVGVLAMLFAMLKVGAEITSEGTKRHKHKSFPKFIVVDDSGTYVSPRMLVNEDWVRKELTITSENDIWFAVDDFGGLYLLDSCGNYVSVPAKYRAVF